MTAGGPGGFLEFFILEAGDYVEQLDGLLLGGSVSGPDPDAMQRVARALRGTATMAKIPSFAELAQNVERVGRALQDGAVRWEPALGGALVAAIDDLKILLRAARNWSPAEDQRATTRSAELSRYAPARTPSAQAAAQPAANSSASYFATEASNIAAGLELLTTRSGDADMAANVLRRVRALRGVAGVKEVGPLADVLEATEDAARGLEGGQEALSNEGRQLLESAAAYLRTLSSALRGEGDVNAPGSSRDAFAAAHDNWSTRAGERDHVVPIADLFYGEGDGLVQESPNPPTSARQRFRLELVSLGEHLHQVVEGARQAGDTASTTRSRRDLKRALRALQAAAMSFGENEVAEFISGHLDAADHLDFLGLSALGDLAGVLAEPGQDGEKLMARLKEMSGGRDLSSAIAMGFGSEQPVSKPATPTPAAPRESRPSPLAVATPAFTAPVAPTPVAPPVAPPPAPAPVMIEALDNTSAALIDSSIAALDALNDRPFAEPAALPEDDIVPIESILYRGRAALDRAVEIRDQIRKSGNRADNDVLEELFDLIELARAG
jgi:HPt (histidine-containing phosphotransfer) domain-containing protein